MKWGVGRKGSGGWERLKKTKEEGERGRILYFFENEREKKFIMRLKHQ